MYTKTGPCTRPKPKILKRNVSENALFASRSKIFVETCPYSLKKWFQNESESTWSDRKFQNLSVSRSQDPFSPSNRSWSENCFSGHFLTRFWPFFTVPEGSLGARNCQKCRTFHMSPQEAHKGRPVDFRRIPTVLDHPQKFAVTHRSGAERNGAERNGWGQNPENAFSRGGCLGVKKSDFFHRRTFFHESLRGARTTCWRYFLTFPDPMLTPPKIVQDARARSLD